MAYAPLELADFSGGLNLLDNPQPNQAIDMMNMEIDQAGRVRKRLGFERDGGMSAFAADIQNVLGGPGGIYVQEGVNLRKRTGAGTFSLVKAFSDASQLTFAEFNGKLLILHPVDDLWAYDGATLTGPFASTELAGRNGTTLAVWQNKVWIGDGQSQRVLFSVPGDHTDFAGAGSGNVELHEASAGGIYAMVASPRLGLLVFKPASTAAAGGGVHRIFDSETGEYTTIDQSFGASDQVGVCIVNELVIGVNLNGIFVSDGVSAFKQIGQAIQPLFGLPTPLYGNFGSGTYPFPLTPLGNGHVLIGGKANLTLDLDPTNGVVVPHSFGTMGVAVSSNHRYRGGMGSSQRFLYHMDFGGTDDGVNTACWYQTPWAPLNGRKQAWVQQVTVESRGDFSLYLRRDREESGGTLMTVDGAASTIGTQRFYPRKLAREVSLRLEDTSSATGTEPKPLQLGGTTAYGGVALHHVELDLTSAES